MNCSTGTLICNQQHLLHTLREYETFYNAHRPHQGIANARPPAALPEPITSLDQLARIRIRRRDLVELLHEDRIIATTKAYIELHSRPGTTPLVLPGVDPSQVQPGHVVRAARQ
ncbi:hypothetical protein [Planosporangium mesophilum]|uniref:Integrase n=1 Tax=Planosporangium mesophilum TaxID=689768 RepID=A0A8J3WZW5_9ACTN|nr:hypothetical protein [Planosporangium mesophilum]GII22745.1 hypothetical protein Pme01_23420 [Planosporangium mesophilum]